MFDENRQKHARLEFASTLRAIICQRLVMKKDKSGFLPAVEILLNNPRVRGILEDETKSASLIYEVIESSKETWNMQSFNQHLIQMWEQGLISETEALKASHQPEKLRMRFSGLSQDSGKDARGRAARPAAAGEGFAQKKKLVMETDFQEMKTVFDKKAKRA